MKKDNQYCSVCENEFVSVEKFPCLFCKHGKGKHNRVFFKEKRYVLTKKDIEEAVERLRRM